MTWVNDDGLVVRFGTEQGTADKAGSPRTAGDVSELVVKITGTDVPSTDAPVSTQVGIPDGAYLMSATLYVSTAFTSGGAATLDIGLFNDDGDGTYSANDADGIDAAIAITAIDADDDEIACDGALVGTTLAGTGDRPLYVSYGYGTAAYTAGEAELVIQYRV